MAFSVIQTGGKQYKVEAGTTLKVEKLDSVKEGDTVTFDKVMLTDSGSATKIGTPYIAGEKVTGKVTKIGKHPTLLVVKYRPKSRYFKKNGHRQPFTEVTIEKLG